MAEPFQLAAPLQQVDRTYVLHKGRKLSYFGGCDYFRLSSHPRIQNAMRDAIEKYGINVAASRVTTGNHPLYEELENRLRSFFAVEAALVVASGYVANLALAEALEGEFTHALVDERSHSSLKTALRLTGAKLTSFRHRNPADLRKQIGGSVKKGRVLVTTDGMFAQDGEIAPLAEYARILPKHDVLLVDDAHGAGTLGRTGKGTPELLGVRDSKLVRTITFSKAFGVFGGAILGSKQIREKIIRGSRLFIGQTPPPLPVAAAVIATLELLRADTSLRQRLDQNTTFFKSRLRALGFVLPRNPSPIATFVPTRVNDIAAFKRALLQHAIFPSWIRYPGGPKHGYFRFALSSEHTPAQLEALMDAFMRLQPDRAARKNRPQANAG
jgi:7-keto-8-aminopelargonate synthetase-like enzyme